MTAGIIATVVSLEQVCLGGDSYFLGAVFAPMKIVTALMALILLRPGMRFWASSWPVLLVLALAMTWLAQPMVAPRLIAAHTATMLVPDLALNGICRMLGDVGLLLAAAWLAFSRNGMRQVIDLLIAGGVLCILIGAVMQQIEPGQVWGEIKIIQASRFSGTMANSNAAACLFAMLALLACARAEERWRALAQTGGASGEWVIVHLTVMAAGLAAGACALAQSRTAFIALLFGLPLVLIPSTSRRERYWMGCILFVASLCTMLAWLALAGGLSGRFVSFQTDFHTRQAMWQHYLALARAAAWTGYGPLGFDAANARSWYDLHQAISFSYIHSPHNLLLSIMLIGGLPYLALLTMALGLIGRTALRARLPCVCATLFRPLAASLLVLGACSFTDIGADFPVVASLGSVVLGLLWGQGINSQLDPSGAISRHYIERMHQG